jgi:peptide/nickel transport system permease protein
MSRQTRSRSASWTKVQLGRDQHMRRRLQKRHWLRLHAALTGGLSLAAMSLISLCLLHAGVHLKDPAAEWATDITQRVLLGLLMGALAGALLWAAVVFALARRHKLSWREAGAQVWHDETVLRWRAGLLTVFALCLLAGPAAMLMNDYHLLGTDRTGNDVFYQALKSIRTAFVIGTLATLATLPLAMALGLMAGYFKGWVDEAIQYFYTVLSSVPNVLLIAACVLMVQV